MRMYLAYGDDGGKFYIGEAGLEFYGPDILTPPHRVDLPPQPEPEPLTEEELAECAALLDRYAQLIPHQDDREVLHGLADSTDRLLEEVRRLRAVLVPLAETPPIQYQRGDYPHCAYCGGYIGYPDWIPAPAHTPDCEWVAARVALGMSRADSW